MSVVTLGNFSGCKSSSGPSAPTASFMKVISPNLTNFRRWAACRLRVLGSLARLLYRAHRVHHGVSCTMGSGEVLDLPSDSHWLFCLRIFVEGSGRAERSSTHLDIPF